MERERILGILREHEHELKAAGLLHLRLFGSVARGENTPDSDVDLLFDDDGRTYGLFELVRWKDHLSTLLHTEVDLVPANGIKRSIQAGVLLEAIRAF